MKDGQVKRRVYRASRVRIKNQNNKENISYKIYEVIMRNYRSVQYHTFESKKRDSPINDEYFLLHLHKKINM